jgi:hypothetical protein
LSDPSSAVSQSPPLDVSSAGVKCQALVRPASHSAWTSNYLKILVDAGKTLILDGTDISGDRLVQPLPASLVKAIAANGHEVGLTVRIHKEALVVTLRAGSKKEIETFTSALALTTEQRERVLDRSMALLSRGGRHEMTPYLDIPRADKPDPANPAPPNRWRHPGDPQLYAIYRAAWRLGNSAPPSLLALRHDMLAAADGPEDVQRNTVAVFTDRLPTVLNEIEKGDGPARARKDALVWLRETISTVH